MNRVLSAIKTLDLGGEQYVDADELAERLALLGVPLRTDHDRHLSLAARYNSEATGAIRSGPPVDLTPMPEPGTDPEAEPAPAEPRCMCGVDPNNAAADPHEHQGGECLFPKVGAPAELCGCRDFVPVPDLAADDVPPPPADDPIIASGTIIVPGRLAGDEGFAPGRAMSNRFVG